MEEGRKRVVVVGGGVAGSLTSKLLENAADVTLVDPYSLSFSVHPYVLVITILCLF
jgi:NADH dehydrogenase FAD-containing subunit